MRRRYKHNPAWDKAAKELEDFFATAALPETATLQEGTTVVDVPLFVAAHLECIRANHNNKLFLPYANRLRQLKTFIEDGTTNQA